GRQGKFESVHLTRGERAAIRPGAILIGRRSNLSVPVHLEMLSRGVEQAAGEVLPFASDEAGPAAGAYYSEDFRGLLVDLDRPRVDRKHRRGCRCRYPAGTQGGGTGRQHGRLKKSSAADIAHHLG